MKKVDLAYRYYCSSYPAFEWCLLLLLSLGLCFHFSLILVLLTGIFLFLELLKYENYKKKIFHLGLKLIVLFLMYSYGYTSFVKYNQEIEPLSGTAHLVISDAKKTVRFGKSIISYTGKIKSFKTADKTLKNLPCRLLLKNHKPLNVDTEYIIENANLSKDKQKLCVLKNQKNSRFIKKTTHRFSLVKLRYKLKRAVDKKLRHSLKNKHVYHLLSALSLGYSDNKTLNFEFSKLGLQHLLAISGFHFALVSAALGLVLRKFFSLKITSASLIFLMTVFMLYIGNSPSILRAYFTIVIFLIGHLFSLKPKAINSLCIACIFLLLFNPKNLLSLGFQLSFSATFGILALFTFMKDALSILVKERTLNEALKLKLFDQGVYLIIYTFKDALALNLAVALTTLPLIFYHIGSYPLFSMIYNMIIPVCVALSMILLLASFFFCFFPFLEKILYVLNNHFTSTYLIFVSHPPPIFSTPIYLKLSFDLTILFFTLTLILSWIVHFKKSPFYLRGSVKSLLT